MCDPSTTGMSSDMAQDETGVGALVKKKLASLCSERVVWDMRQCARNVRKYSHIAQWLSSLINFKIRY